MHQPITVTAATMREIETASKAYARHVTGDHACPECGSPKERHEDNGRAPTAYDYTILCLDCEHQWSPNEG